MTAPAAVEPRPAPRGEAPLALDDALALPQQGNAAFTTDMVQPDATPPLPPTRPPMTPEQALAVQVGDHVQYRDRLYTVLAIREAGLINVRDFALDGLPGAPLGPVHRMRCCGFVLGCSCSKPPLFTPYRSVFCVTIRPHTMGVVTLSAGCAKVTIFARNIPG